jgi:hypothetical protein
MSTGSSDEPRNLVEHAADAGMQAIAETLAHADAEIEQVLVVLVAKDVPTGEPDSVTAGHGIEDATDLVALLTSHFISAARAVGLDVKLVPVQRMGEG